MVLNLFLFYQAVRPLGRKSVNKYLYLVLVLETASEDCGVAPNSISYSAPPDPLAGLRGPTSKGREGGREGEGKGRGEGG